MTPAFSFQDPKIILSSTPNATSKRLLPKPPSSPTQQPFSPSHNSNSSELINQSPSPQFNTNPLQQPPQIRRASSSRMLPTPPPNAHGTDFSQTPVSPTMNMFSPSPSPPFSSTDLRRPSTGRRLPPEPTVSVVLTSLPPPAPNHLNHLQRSASARTPTVVTTNKSAEAQLPPPSPRSSISTSQPPSAQPSTNDLSSSAMSRLAPDTATTTTSNGHTGNVSPRPTRNSMTEGSPSFVFARKFSTDVSRDSLARNGSMAHLLEQQHQNLLRREFTATPDSMVHSNNSSLSPSIEQLNCAVSTKSSSDNEDPSVHGLDLSLYGADGKSPQTPTNSSSTHDITTATHSSSSMTLAQSAINATNNENELRPRGLGLIYCSLQHFPVRKRLRVSVLKIEGLAGELRPDLEIQPFCRVSIVPVKKNVPQVSFVKHGRNAVFNQEFFFDGIASEDIDSKSLSIEVCHQSAQKLQKDLEIGEINVNLKDLSHQLHSKKEMKITEELKFQSHSKKLGKIYITSCIDKENRLTINIIKVEDLPKFGIIGAPDVCVRITMQQGNGNPQTKSSRILKSTCKANYNEAVMFLVATKKNDLMNTKITISVHDISRSVTGDDVIGSSFLGQLAVDKSEIDQWKNTMEHIGKEYKGSHQLKQHNQTQIHVSEIPENNDEDEEDYED